MGQVHFSLESFHDFPCFQRIIMKKFKDTLMLGKYYFSWDFFLVTQASEELSCDL